MQARDSVLALAGFVLATSAQAGPVEYVRVCDVYGTGYFYIPGTETCVHANTGQTRRETINGTEYGETDLARRISALEERMGIDTFSQIAISNALQSPNLVAGETFGLRINWGTAEESHAFGLSGAVSFGDGLFADGRGRMSGYGGVAFSGDSVGGNAGLQLSW
ncbi:porin [Aquibium sp. ELW1220]|uniref:porin n=1 Tax=Aquibium sp. ELW1220 TaxID=2976766 RepID=UPI0025AF854B|nr:porin [Aquibium sp. ELW1220]MDN2579544.1 porin [Aquibium sp. ELW1220]